MGLVQSTVHQHGTPECLIIEVESWLLSFTETLCISSEGLNADLELKGQANVLYYMQLLLDSHCAVQH